MKTLEEIKKQVEFVKTHCEHCDCCIGDYSECACVRGLLTQEEVEAYLQAVEQ